MKEDYRIVLEIDDGENKVYEDVLLEKKQFLHKFDSCKEICIQCHDNPDADALASGYALYCYFESKGIRPHLIYSGKNRITKPNLLLMVKELDIPIEYAEELPACDMLITADCQYGAGNVTRFETDRVAIIDHHQCGMVQNEYHYIRSNLGSCSTVIWDLLNSQEYDVNQNIHLSTTLYYGLYSDTNQFGEMYHPLDRDMKDSLVKDEMLLFQLMNTNLSLGEMSIASEALSRQQYCQDYKFSVIASEECDPNILGIISDFAIQVQEIDSCVVFNPNPGGYKLSIRSCVKETKANELAEYLCDGLGNGGGHITKAGGFIAENLFRDQFGDRSFADVIFQRTVQYYKDFEIIYSRSYNIDLGEFQRYQKRNITVGVAVASDFIKVGTPILVRTLEGDVNLNVEEDLYLMIGVEGEVYPIRREKFERSYRYVEDTPHMKIEYAPTVRDNIFGDVYQLMKYMKTCRATGETRVYAKQLKKNVKVFTMWDESKYYRGVVGDFLVVREDDFHDIYVVQEDIFYETYEKAQEK